MSLKHTLSIIVFLVIYMHGHAGTKDSSKHFYISEALISGGAFGQSNPEGTLANFQKLAPGSTLLRQNYSGFHEYSSISRGAGNPMLMLGIGFRSNRRDNGPTYRFGVGYGILTDMEGQFYTDYKFRIDTLTSSRTGEQIFIDSTVSETYDFHHMASLLKLDVSVVWRTSVKHKTKLFAGIGCFAGTSLYAQTIIDYSKYHHVNSPFRNYSNRSLPNNNYSTSETYQQKSQSMAAIYFPFGVDYQLSKKSSFFKNINLFMEFRAQLYYKKIPELGKTVDGGVQVNVGIRYNLNQKG